MSENKALGKYVYHAAFLVVTALVLTYIFLGTDLIPDSIGLVLPGKILGFVDDAALILGAVFFLAKVKQKTIGGKTEKGVGFWGWVITMALLAGVLLYVFLPLDFIADAIPWVGFMDDAGVAITGLGVARRIRRNIKG